MSSRVLIVAAVALSFLATAAVAVALWPDRDPTDDSPDTAASAASGSADAESSAAAAERDPAPTGSIDAANAPPDAGGAVVPAQTSASTSFALQPVPEDPPVEPRLKRPPAAGILFDVESGEVLWVRHATLARPIASLTKLMTALLIAEGGIAGQQVLVSAKAGHTPGSATGVLPEGKAVPIEPLLQALIMISANDAAVALAEHHSGSSDLFIAEMNRRAAQMGLECTHFSTPNGLKDRDNYSCPLDVAALARAALAEKRIAAIARTRYAKPPFPIKGGRLHLANNHYFLQRGLARMPGAEVTGLKTGLTDGAGRCYVTTARIGSTHLGVVLLDSPDPLGQVPLLLRAGFEEAGVLQPLPPPAKKPPRASAGQPAPAG
jgi:serine-type D-Ala-D-Ala carboxypeptidase (penicillin-binding protein 5/6)